VLVTRGRGRSVVVLRVGRGRKGGRRKRRAGVQGREEKGPLGWWRCAGSTRRHPSAHEGEPRSTTRDLRNANGRRKKKTKKQKQHSTIMLPVTIIFAAAAAAAAAAELPPGCTGLDCRRSRCGDVCNATDCSFHGNVCAGGVSASRGRAPVDRCGGRALLGAALPCGHTLPAMACALT